MSKRRKPVIPDFSRKPKMPGVVRPDAAVAPPKPPTVAQNVKPQATSAKSGRRGV